MSRFSCEKGFYAFLWKIENIEYYVPESNLILQSPTFNSHWILDISSTLVNKQDFLWLRLRNVGSKLQNGTVDCEVSLLAADDTVIRSRKILGAEVAEWVDNSCIDYIPMSEIIKSKVRIFSSKHILKVFCRIGQHGMKSGQDMARTVFYNDTFIWNIEKFCDSQKTTTKKVQFPSRDFTMNFSKSGSFAKTGTVDVTIQMEEKDLQFARCQLSFSKTVGEEKNILRDDCFRPGTLKRSWNFSINLEQELILKTCLPLQCEFTIATDEIWMDPIPELFLQTTVNYVLRNLGGLSEDVWSMYRNKKFCDVALKSSSGMKFFAHKSILSARSPVFGAMFEDKRLLLNVDLSDVDSHTLRRMLKYIYNDGLPNLLFKEHCQLYAAAHKYGVKHLEDKCMSGLKAKLSIPNACEALEVAEVHGNEALKQCVMEFIQEHYEEVIGADEWKSLEENKPKLVIQVFREMGLKKFKKSD